MFLSIIKPPPALRSQVWKILYYHSDHPFSFICKSMRASSASSHSNEGFFKATWGEKEVFSLMLLGFKHCLYLKSLLISLLISPFFLAALSSLTNLGNLEALGKKKCFVCPEYEDMLNNEYTDVKLHLSCSLCRQNTEIALNTFCCKRTICFNG